MLKRRQSRWVRDKRAGLLLARVCADGVTMHHTMALAMSVTLVLATAMQMTPLAQSRGPESKPNSRTARRIASLAGVCVGVDNMRTLASRLGCSGMPRNHGERTWLWKAARCRIRAVSAGGEQDDAPLGAVCMERMAADALPDEPQAHGLVRALGWLGSITPGVSRRVVEARSRSLGPPDEAGPQEMVWRGSLERSARNEAPSGANRCAAVLRFESDKLVSIRVVWR